MTNTIILPCLNYLLGISSYGQYYYYTTCIFLLLFGFGLLFRLLRG